MISSTTSIPSTHTYYGNSEINFVVDDRNALTVTIDTERLHIRSVEPSEEDITAYAELFGDKEVMSKYATGETKTREDIQKRIKDIWVKRWHQNDPYSGLAICKKKNGKCIGHVVVGYGDEPGQAELAYLLKKKYWKKGFGTETVTAVVREYAPAIVKEGYALAGKNLKNITATARPDNPASVKILKKVGMKKFGEEKKHGAIRHHFSIDLSTILQENKKNA